MNSFTTSAHSFSRGVQVGSKPQSIYVYRFSIRWFLLQVFCCTLPAASLLALGKGELAGKGFCLLFGMLMLWTTLRGRRDELLCMLLAAAPFLSLLRSYVFYNIIIAFFVASLGYYFFSTSGRLQSTVKRFALFWGVIIWVGLYYLISFYNTHDYSLNLRLFELGFTVLCILLLSRSRLLLGAALVANVLSAWLIGISMLPHMGSSDRLGIVMVEGRLLGNPGQLGLPLAFGFLTLMFDRGRWLNLQNLPLIRWIMLAVTTILLALTTSRAAWLVAAVGIVLLLLFGKAQRGKLLVACCVGIVAIAIVLMTPYAAGLKKGWNRTFGEGQSVRKVTSGRSDQWIVARYAFTRDITTIVHGHGPGYGPQVYAKYSPEVPGVKYAIGKKVALHSLFMQLMVETGIVGLVCFIGWLLAIFGKSLSCIRQYGLLPLACFFAYVLTCISVSGSDINSGILLGMALVGTAPLMASISTTGRIESLSDDCTA